MNLWKRAALFFFGGCGYILLELLWRGWSHVSMFFLGGLCFVAIGHLGELRPAISLPGRMLLGAGIITAGELGAGMLVNRSYTVWDYRGMPFHFMGQICLPFALLWIPVSLLAIGLYHLLAKKLLHLTYEP